MARTIPIQSAVPQGLQTTALEGDGMGCHAGGETLLAAAKQAEIGRAHV